MTARRLALLQVVSLCVFAVLSLVAQEPESGEGPDHAKQREEWFSQSRLVNGKLPAALRLKALEKLKTMRADEKARRKQRFGDLAPAQGAQSTAVSAQDLSLAASGAQWTPIGPDPMILGSTLFSGRVSSIAIDPRNSNVVYIGAADGGIWKTTNGGASWQPLTDFQDSLSSGSITLDPANPDTVYVGTGEPYSSSSAYYGAGILKSSDAGSTWQNIQAPFVTSTVSLRIGGIDVYPNDHNVVLAATSRTQGSGIYRSTNGGATWTPVYSGGPVYKVRFLPNAPNTAIAVGFDDNTFNQQVILRSTDAGATWQVVVHQSVDFGFGDLTAQGSLAIGTGHNTIYAALGGNAAALLFKSTDAGATWTAVNNKLPSGQAMCNAQCWYGLALAVHPADPNLLYFGAVNLYRSTDGGNTWTGVTSEHVDYHALTFTPAGDRLYVANDGGIWSTSDPRASVVGWTSLNAGMATLQFYPGISIAPGNPSFGLGGTQDNGILRYTGDPQWANILIVGDGISTAIDPATTSRLYGTTQGGFVWLSTNGGSSFTQQTNGLNLSGASFLTPLTMDSHNSMRLYTAPTQFVYRTDNGGSNWTQASDNLFSAVTNIAVAPTDENTVYASAGSGVGMTRNAISASSPTWTVHNGPGRKVTWVTVDPADATVAYAVLGGFSSIDGKGHVYKITNSGATWTNITANLPDTPVNNIIVDPDVANTLYIATDTGVFSTSDGGQSWNSMVENMPHSIVMGLALERSTRTLRAATHGRSMFDLKLPSVAPGCPVPSTNGVNICTPAAGATVTSPVRVTASAKLSNPPKLMELWIDGVKKASQPGNQLDYTATLANGTHALAVYGVDTTDAKLNKKITITVASATSGCTPPSTSGVNICTPAAGSTVSSPVSVTAAAKSTNPISSMEVWIDGAKKTTVSGNQVNYSATLANGTHTVSVYGIDTTGAKVNKKISFTVGSSSGSCSAPATSGVNICTPAAGATVKSPVRITAAAKSTNPIARMELWIDGVKKASPTGNQLDYSATLVSGSHTISVYGIDTAGLKVNKKISITVSP
jgi:photosystem II stability/assembly factor-like uncharacterized protein